MDKVRKYIDRFFKNRTIPCGYDMTAKIWRELAVNAERDPVNATCGAFLYGYAKGYRACKAEIEKGGDVA